MRLSTHQGHSQGLAARRILTDMAIWISSFAVGAGIRFFGNPEMFYVAVANYLPALAISSFFLVAVGYILGLYSATVFTMRWRRRIALITGCLLAAFVVLLAIGSIHLSWQVGRGVILLGVIPATLALWFHHTLIHKLGYGFRERAVIVVTSAKDEAEALLLVSMGLRNWNLLGCFVRKGYELKSDIPFLGYLDEVETSVNKEKTERIVCTSDSMKNAEVAHLLRRLRYSGVAISDTAQACEEFYQAVPLDLIDDEWLLHACGQPKHMYIAKTKRLVDIMASLAIGVFLLPFMLLGALLVWAFGGKGPIFYRQERLGRFGHRFEVIKLRTMCDDAEAGGAQWSVENDPRITTVGHYLRKFRIDEVPQLWNILRGDMSFVGPRPERPQFTEELSQEIPYFSERLLIHPGLTGWAQVCYPYSATVQDARRKLEFDLYYLKNMGLVMDLFVLLDTVKIIIMGGASHRRGKKLGEFEKKLEDARQQVSSKVSNHPASKRQHAAAV